MSGKNGGSCAQNNICNAMAQCFGVVSQKSWRKHRRSAAAAADCAGPAAIQATGTARWFEAENMTLDMLATDLAGGAAKAEGELLTRFDYVC